MKRTCHPWSRAGRQLAAAALTAVLLAGPAEAGAAERLSSTRFTIPQERSFQQINQYYKDHPYNTSMADEYAIRPDIANPALNALIGTDGSKLEGAANEEKRDKLAGKLTDATLTNALNATNFLRYSAGLEPVTIHTEDAVGGKQWRAQAGAAMLAELGQMTHNVSWADAEAAGISRGLYDWATAGPSQSNGVQGSGVAGKVVNSFMPDIGNDHTGLSHRSYILNPSLVSTGFGAANIPGKGSAVLMHVTWFGTDPYQTTAVMWPGQKQPIETFQPSGPQNNPYQWNPWSFFVNTADAAVDSSRLKVTLECNGETEILEFSKLTETEKKDNRLFVKSSFPLKLLIAFRPYHAYGAGDKVTVTIDGIAGKDGLPIPVTYDVHFFQTGTEPHPNLEQVKVTRNQVSAASVSYEADYAGTLYYLLKDAEEAAPTADEVLAGKKLELAAGKAALELSALAGGGAKKLYYVTASATMGGKAAADAAQSGELSRVLAIGIPASAGKLTPAVTAPAARTLTYNGTAQALVTAGSATGGTLEYSLTPGTGFSTAIPTAVNAGDYTVYYRVTGNERYASVPERSLRVRVGRAVVTVAAISREITRNDRLTWLYTPEEGTHYTVSGLAKGDRLSGTVSLLYLRDGRKAQPDTGAAGTYEIVLSGVTEPAGGNYGAVSFKPGTLTVLDTATYAVELAHPVNGTVAMDWKNAAPGTRVTLTVTAETGYALSSLTARGPDDRPLTLKPGPEGSYTFVMPDGAVMVESVFKPKPVKPVETPALPAVTFEDVTAEDYYHDAVRWAVRAGITTGVDEKSFVPHASCTRAQMVTFLWRAAGCPEPETAGHDFLDVTRGAYYETALRWAIEAGITNGVTSSTFAPNAAVTRAQTVTFLYRAEGERGGASQSFRDVSAGAYYAGAVAWAAERGITGGVGGGRFDPDANCTRAQIVTMLFRAAK